MVLREVSITVLHPQTVLPWSKLQDIWTRWSRGHHFQDETLLPSDSDKKDILRSSSLLYLSV